MFVSLGFICKLFQPLTPICVFKLQKLLIVEGMGIVTNVGQTVSVWRDPWSLRYSIKTLIRNLLLFMSAVSLVFHTVVKWNWSQKCIWNRHTRSVTLDIHASTVERPLTCFLLKPHSANFIKTNSSQPNKSFNSRLDIYFGVVQDWYKSILRNEDSDPYPNSNEGKN